MKKRIFTATILATVFLAFFCVGALADSDTEDRYGRSTATGNVAYAYDLIRDGVMADFPTEKIEFDADKKLTYEQLSRAYALFTSDYPECFWLGTNYRYADLEGTIVAIEPNYSFTGSALTEAKSALSAEIDKILIGMPNDSDYEKALYLHDALADNTEYMLVGQHQTAYGALVSKKAVCAGYAAAYQLLLMKADIPAWTVSGESYDPTSNATVPHAWCVMWIDGKCLYTDVTWDDQADELYHAYFALEKSEIEKDHTVNSNHFTLPPCEHHGEKYFDKIGHTVTDSMTASEFATLFDTTKTDVRTAEFSYGGTTYFGDWLDSIFNDLYEELGGKPTYNSRYSFTSLGDEIHLSIMGDMPIMTHTVSISIGKNIGYRGEKEQTVKVGENIDEIILTADDGYYFPIDYSVFDESGITVKRQDFTTVKIFGTPERSLSLVLESATKKQKLSTPDASFLGTGAQSGILTGLSASSVYSTDGGESWTEVGGESAAIASGISAEIGLMVKNRGDGNTTLDSDVQKISLTKASLTRYAITHAESASGNDGKINGLTAEMEYKAEGGEWMPCGSETVDGLAAGIYYVRMRSDVNKLASESLAVRVGSTGDVAVKGVKLVLDSELKLNESHTASCEFTPASVTNNTVYFSTDKTDVLEIDVFTGEVICKSRGTAKVTVVSQDGGYSDEIEVIVLCTHANTEMADGLPACREGEIFYSCTACGQAFDSDGNEIAEIPKSHLYADEYECDEDHHWHECSCGEKTVKNRHVFGEWSDFEDESGEKKKMRSCDECGYTDYRHPGAFDKILDFVKANAVYIAISGCALVFGAILISKLKRKK